MKAQSGYSYYGQDIGILVNASTSPRLPGDAGHAASFRYQVRYQITGTSFMDMQERNEETKSKIISAAKKLVDAGCKGLIADCGLMSLYQKDVTEALHVPFVSASLILIPTIWEMIGHQGKIGIITGSSIHLKKEHLLSCGYREDIDIAIEGLQKYPHFNEIVISGGMNLDVDKMTTDMLNAAENLMKKAPNVSAIILECSNLGTYTKAVHEATGLPVFDTICACDLMQYSLNPQNYL